MARQQGLMRTHTDLESAFKSDELTVSSLSDQYDLWFSAGKSAIRLYVISTLTSGITQASGGVLTSTKHSPIV